MDAPPDDDGLDPFERYVVPEIEVLYRVALSITRNRADAEDVVQETLLRAYRAIDRFDGRYPRAWLLTILRNANRNRVRRRRPELLRDPDDGPDLLEQGTEPIEGPEEQLMATVLDAEVAEALDRLPDRFRRVVDLVDVDGLSYAEAAEVLAVPVGTVMSRLHRARKRLRSSVAALQAQEETT